MKYNGQKWWWFAAMMLILGLQNSYATVVLPGPIKNVKLEPMSELTTDGPVTMSLIIIPRESCGDTIMYQLIPTPSLTVVGPDTRTVVVNADGVFKTEFDIVIPDNDTSEIVVKILDAPPHLEFPRCFVTTADTIEYYYMHPTKYPWHSKPQSGRSQVLIKPSEPTVPDSNTYRFSLEPAPPVKERQLAEMRQLEKEPLTDAQVQYHNVGKELYRRLEGEKVFTLVVRKSAEELRAEKQAYLDSLAGLPPNAKVRVCLNLRGDHLQFVKEMVGPLPTPESESYYHLTVTKELLEQLKEKGVPIMYLDLEDRVHRPHPSDQPPPPVPCP